MTRPIAAVLIDGENMFRGRNMYGHKRIGDLFNSLITALGDDLRLEYLRCYGKAADPSIQGLIKHVPKLPHWVVTLVADGEDVADHALCLDLKLMSNASSATRFIVGSSDKTVLDGAQKVCANGTRKVRVVLRGRHVEETCHIHRYPGLVDEHVHICDVVRDSFKDKKQSAESEAHPGQVTDQDTDVELELTAPEAADNVQEREARFAPLRNAATYDELRAARKKLEVEIDAAPGKTRAELWEALEGEWGPHLWRVLQARAFSGDSAHDAG